MTPRCRQCGRKIHQVLMGEHGRGHSWSWTCPVHGTIAPDAPGPSQVLLDQWV